MQVSKTAIALGHRIGKNVSVKSLSFHGHPSPHRQVKVNDVDDHKDGGHRGRYCARLVEEGEGKAACQAGVLQGAKQHEGHDNIPLQTKDLATGFDEQSEGHGCHKGDENDGHYGERISEQHLPVQPHDDIGDEKKTPVYERPFTALKGLPQAQTKQDPGDGEGGKDKLQDNDPELQGFDKAHPNEPYGNEGHQCQPREVAAHVAQKGKADIPPEKLREGHNGHRRRNCCNKDETGAKSLIPDQEKVAKR